MMRKPLSGKKSSTQSTDLERSVGAPVGGLNSRDPLAGMKPTDALVLDNFICTTTTVKARSGQQNFVTGFGATEKVWSLLPYRAAPSDKMFAATDSGIYDVTTSGVVGAVVTACTSGKWEYLNGANAGIRYLVAVNGVDPAKLYNGAAWANAAITGVSPSDLTNLLQFKFRIYFTQKDTLSFWYLAVNAVQGAATEFPLSPLFARGGSLLALGSWSLDGGSGMDDYFAAITTEGEVAVYQGTDPSNAATWALIGTYLVPKPIGKKCLYKYGGDLLIITESGIVPMSKVLQAVAIERDSAISDKIVGALNTDTALYKSNYGWSLTLLSAQNLLILNVPVTDGVTSKQYVMNTVTGAWSTFSGMKAFCFLELGSRLFYGALAKVVLALTGESDFDANIPLRAMTSYNGFGDRMRNKQVKLFRPNLKLNRSITVNLAIAVNYEAAPYTAPGSTGSNNVALWNFSNWNQALWGGADFIDANWRSVAHKPGYVLALVMEVNEKDYILEWNSNDYLLEVGSSFP